MQSMLENVKVSSCLAYASGTAARNGAIVDMSGYETVAAIIVLATLAAGSVGDVHWEEGDESDLSDAADLAGTAIAIAADDDDEILVTEVVRPTKRYIRAVITKDGSNAAAEAVVYLRGNPKKIPVVNTVADTVTAEIHHSPVAGTK